MLLNFEKAWKTCMVQGHTADRVIELIQKGLNDGADAFGIQLCRLQTKEKTKENLKKIFDATQGKPIYVTNYRYLENDGKSDEQLSRELLEITDNNRMIVDIMGDMFCLSDIELTMDKLAIEKQKCFIEKVHQKGGKVLMSTHLMEKFTSPERVLEIAKEQEKRGVDIVKIVTMSDTDEEFLQTIQASKLLKENLKTPFLYLTVGSKCEVHRILGAKLGNCMWLCVVEYDELATKSQPLLKTLNKLLEDKIL